MRTGPISICAPGRNASALHAIDDITFDQVALAIVAQDFVPGSLQLGLVHADHWSAVLVLEQLEEHLQVAAHLEFLPVVGKIRLWDKAFRL